MLTFACRNYLLITDMFTWALAFFLTLVVVEAIILIILLIKLQKLKNIVDDRGSGTMAFVPLAALSAFPTNWLVCAILAFIVFLVLLIIDIYVFRTYLAYKAQLRASAVTEAAYVPESDPEPAPVHLQINEPTEEEMVLVAELVRETITIEEAHEAISDTVASHFVEVEKSDDEVEYKKKGIVNIDTLSENFENGDTVTVELLREKGLVPKGTDYVKVLARGFLNKHLIVEAQDFSADAVKMIILTGGKVHKKV